MVPVLQFADVRKEYRSASGAVQAVDGVSLDLAPGEMIALVGRSGCGK